MRAVTVIRIESDNDGILRNLSEHYAHDVSEWFGGETKADGRFVYDTSQFWRGDFAVYLAKVGDCLAGFAVVGSAERWLGKQATRDVKDFFVLRAHRRSGVAAAMALFIWNEFPAEWLVRVLAANKSAIPFWRRAVRDYIGDAHQENAVTDQRREWIHLRFDSSKRLSDK
jgi:predicted acetyltransferase